MTAPSDTTPTPPSRTGPALSARALVGAIARDALAALSTEFAFGEIEWPSDPQAARNLDRVALSTDNARADASRAARATPHGSGRSSGRASGRASGSAASNAASRASRALAPDQASTRPTPAGPARRGTLELPALQRLVDLETGAAGLARIRAELGDCRRCRLCEGRQQLVFGEGAPDASLVFVGEGPGFNEDQQGRPFVGKAGELLDRMIGAMGYSRQQVYIANIVKCRPPDNRDPEWDERLACRPFVIAQIEAIRPRVVVALGRVASQTLLETDQLISRIRGRWFPHPHLPDIQVMPTYHPAALLRNENLKRPVWEDLKSVMNFLRSEP